MVKKVVMPAAGQTTDEATVTKLLVKVGDSVKKGDVLCVLEAMKMENEIFAPKSGSVAQVVTSKGASVNTGDVLVVIA